MFAAVVVGKMLTEIVHSRPINWGKPKLTLIFCLCSLITISLVDQLKHLIPWNC